MRALRRAGDRQASRQACRARPRTPRPAHVTSPPCRELVAPRRARTPPQPRGMPQNAGTSGPASRQLPARAEGVSCPPRVASVAGGALVGGAALAPMLAIHLRAVRVLVAQDAFEGPVVAGRDVAIRAARPLATVLSRVDREVAAVVVPVGRTPRARGVTALAGDRESRRLVVRVRGARVVRLVARVAGRGRAGVAPA